MAGGADAAGYRFIDATYGGVGQGNAYQSGDVIYAYCETTFRAMITGFASAGILGLPVRFYDGAMFPPEYKNRILIAEHGSWNRTDAIGYRVMQVRLEDGRAVSYEPFADGWLSAEGRAWGRPADVEVLADGSLLVSDDRNGVLYRITYKM